MGGATFRFITLFSSSPLPILHCRRPSFLLLRHFSSHLLHSPLHTPLHHVLPAVLNCSRQLHSQSHSVWDETQPILNSNPSNYDQHQQQYQHPWPEFSDFLYWVFRSGYSNAPFVSDVVQFVDAQRLSQQFLNHAIACLGFARNHPTLLWSLPREDIEVVVKYGSPFLFSNASAAAARMNSFLRDEANDVLDSDKPNTVDLMEFLLSYAHLATDLSENTQIYTRVETSVRKLFSELANSKGNSVESVATTKKQFSETYKQAPKSFGERVEMKRGDWICPRCSFMNFAKKVKCLQCEEQRPKKFITGGEWECPQCEFFNFSRNMACLRCDCKKPEINPFTNPSSVNVSTEESEDGTEVEQPWFTKIRQLENSSDMNSPLSDSDLPKTFKGGDSRFTESSRIGGDENNITRNISQCLDELIGEKPESGQQQSSDAKFLSQMENKDYDGEPAEKSERWFETAVELQDMKDLSNDISDDDFPEIMPTRKGENRFVVGKKKDRSLTSPMSKRRAAMEQAGNNKYVPFVPFPPGYFAKNKPQEGSDFTQSSAHTGSISSDFRESGDKIDDKTRTVFETPNNINQNPKDFVSQSSSSDENSKRQSTSEIKDSWRRKSLEGSAVKEPDPLDMTEEAKAERWFRRVAQIKDISELSEIPDEDFPSIMPMRKGVNRFVVSKRKTPLERRLASAQSRRNLPDVSSDPKRKETDSN